MPMADQTSDDLSHPLNATQKRYARAATRLYPPHGKARVRTKVCIETQRFPEVSTAPDGAWVSAWVWLPASELKDEDDRPRA
jgi:hypothetical protein